MSSIRSSNNHGKREKVKELKKFGFTLGIFLLLLCIVLWIIDKPSALYIMLTGIASVLISLIVPGILKPIHRIWMQLSLSLGWVMTKVILSILFFLIFTPIGLASKLFRKEFLYINWNESKSSYWNYRSSNEFNPDSYERQF